MREILKNTSNKVYYTLIGIVTVFYTITYVLALHRQNPRIRALKKSLNVLSKFDSYPSGRFSHPKTDSIASIQPQSPSSITTTAISPKQTQATTTVSNDLNPSDDNLLSKQDTDEQQYEMSKFINHDDSDDQNLPSPPLLRKLTKNKKKSQPNISISEGTSDELKPSTDKLNGTKQVSFQIENHHNPLIIEQNKKLSISTVSFDANLDSKNDMYYKLPCPCSTTRQFLIKFHFARPSLQLNKWLCCCCTKKQPIPINHHLSVTSQTEDEATITSLPTISNSRISTTNSDTLRKQLHRHRLQQIRMASTFLIITVSFVLFYLPSILNAERIIKSPIMVYYLFLCTHALNPVIYCFMNPSLRAYVISMFNCCTKQKNGFSSKGRTTSFVDR
jgi:hypothetical protein